MSKSETPSGGRPPAVVLVETQLGENIGAAARAMANFGLVEMRLVNPRDGWPNERARAAASRADHIIDNVKLFATPEEAVADLAVVYATTARSREMTKPVVGPDEAASSMAGLMEKGVATGLMFGRERWGLTNDEVALADAILTLPVDPTFSSLNVAQAVLVTAYEWRKATLGGVLPFDDGADLPASKDDLMRLMDHLETALDSVNYFRPADKRPVMVRNLRGILQKASLTEQEVRTLRGVIAALEVGPLTPEEIAARRRARKGVVAPPADDGETEAGA
ncbi:tRNA/rRNA methyltransferase [Rhodobium orientis]|uniref:tRNA (cytidine/uridine-2'-O-)-methyltransferase TrmJ n=1 Tax=Rhodobium orientis TaxID=34017 RepID=A0A327JS21_9HYPH|nr:RNA methyltransferase [Rhodobium orientis]MBB4301793.1 tRNA/rRNA methyltransferase [Rhodobium orientis]MBK5950592.1 RNA methyltransferase [Rhodobium orientis]RAI28233.1 RNA methyltransferase [Rhodobium orientis]